MHKKSFSLLELLIAITILSIVMFALIQVRVNNISLISKQEERLKASDYILLALDLKARENTNEDIFLKDILKFQNDELRKEINDIKIIKKDKNLSSESFILQEYNIKLDIFSNSYSFEDSLRKNIYHFKIEVF